MSFNPMTPRLPNALVIGVYFGCTFVCGAFDANNHLKHGKHDFVHGQTSPILLVWGE